MPPPVRKAANNSSSGVGIICSFESRPAFSFARLKIEEIFLFSVVTRGFRRQW